MKIDNSLFEKLKELEENNPFAFAYISGRVDALVEIDPKPFSFNESGKSKERHNDNKVKEGVK